MESPASHNQFTAPAAPGDRTLLKRRSQIGGAERSDEGHAHGRAEMKSQMARLFETVRPQPFQPDSRSKSSEQSYTFLSLGRCGPSREFGYFLRNSAKARIASAILNRQSMAIIMTTRIQDGFWAISLHLPCVGTARRSFRAACGPTVRSSGPISCRRFPHTQGRRD